MPRPLKKKDKTRPSKDNPNLAGESSKGALLPDGSSDDVNDLANLMKVRGIAKLGHQSVENFEKKCSQLVEATLTEIDSKLNAHEVHLSQLYQSVEQINEEIEPTEDETAVDRIVDKRFDAEISYFSKVLTALNSEQNDGNEELQRILEFTEDLNSRPDQVAEFSRKMNYECKRGFRIYCDSNKLLADSRRFKERYKLLMKEALGKINSPCPALANRGPNHYG